MTEKSYINILEECFPGIKNNLTRYEALGFFWEESKLFIKEENKSAVSHVALLECSVLIDGTWHNMGAIHGVCTKTDHRGQGLATELIKEAMEWAKDRCEMIFLFTEIPGFYEKLSFKKIQEHRFHLIKHHQKGILPLREVVSPEDNELFLRCFRERDAVSNNFWIKDNGVLASFNCLFASYPKYWSIYYSSVIDGFISFNIKDKTLHLFDIVTNKIPSLDLILEHLQEEIEDIYFYFSPDKLTDEAIPEPHIYAPFTKIFGLKANIMA